MSIPNIKFIVQNLNKKRSVLRFQDGCFWLVTPWWLDGHYVANQEGDVTYNVLDAMLIDDKDYASDLAEHLTEKFGIYDNETKQILGRLDTEDFNVSDTIKPRFIPIPIEYYPYEEYDG